MKLTVVSVFDSKANAYGRPIFAVSWGQALRSFGDEVNRTAEDNTMHYHPEDFSLRLLGTWDDATGIFIEASEHLVVSAADMA